ncbi:prepilin peptidase [Caldisalinibacter kiritimatiensis]|uniref:Prepilin type IV endopeptidase peptidase domain-containing protein n=1 Tax=Caldisalinibacter kiritimatiensis TaxID=1304284 RepID=R1CGJ5_9FIRM|nr:prepilin peptidase [Caldisalinibacter kiritimatiensis]EOD01420.1 hypothetical protein L21TH_0467 [Caldisalinibacter kiritimatiensis]
MIKIILILVVGIAAYYDYKKRIVPDKLIFPSIFIGITIALINKEISKIVAAILLYFFLYLFLYRTRIIPGGDIKVLVFIFTLTDWEFLFKVVYSTMIFTIPLYIYYLIKQSKNGKKEIIPLVVPIFLACIYHVFKMEGASCIKVLFF